MAKSCQTVMADTAISTTASVRGILCKILKLLQAKVPITTINITPTKAAIGICSIRGAPKSTKHNNAMAAVAPDKRPRPPELILIIDCPIIAQPPIPPKRPFKILAPPWATHSRLPLPRVSVISSIRLSVIRLSIRPTAARISAVEPMSPQCPLRV